MQRRIRNSPTIREIIQEFLAGKSEAASFDDIYNHVVKRVTLISKKPRASVFSVLTRMPDVVRTQPSKYVISPAQKKSND